MTAQPTVQAADKEDTVEIESSHAIEAFYALESLVTLLSQEIIRLTSSFLKVKEPYAYDDARVFCWDIFVPAVADLNKERKLRDLVGYALDAAKGEPVTIENKPFSDVVDSFARLEQLQRHTAIVDGKHLVDSLESGSCNSYEAPVRELYEAVKSFEKYRDLRRRLRNFVIDDIPF